MRKRTKNENDGPLRNRLMLRRFFVLVIVLLLVIDRSDHEQDYEQEHKGSFGCGSAAV